MASFKTRRKLLAQGGVQVGAEGDHIVELLAGSVQGDAASVDTACTVEVTGTISNLNDTATIFVTAGSTPVGDYQLYAANVTSACVLTASFYNHNSASVASAPLTLKYLATF